MNVEPMPDAEWQAFLRESEKKAGKKWGNPKQQAASRKAWATLRKKRIAAGLLPKGYRAKNTKGVKRKGAYRARVYRHRTKDPVTGRYRKAA